ncbi:MAG TPA: ATP-binding protein [Kiritimatiellia bacterium]|nr:ATP-binding protein [Kiritimatiellia bacterium]
MNLFHLSILTALLFNVVLGIAVFVTNIRRTVNRAFLGLSAVLVMWLLSLLYGSMADSAEKLALGIRMSSIAGGMVPMFLNALQLAIVQQGSLSRNMLYQLRWWILIYLPIIPICWSGLFLVGAELPTADQTVGNPIYGDGFFLFVLYLLGAFVVLMINLKKSFRSVDGIRRTELLYVVLGCMMAFLSAIVFTVLPKLSGNMELGMLLPLSDIFRVSIIAYGIAKSRILDISNVIRRLIAYALMLAYMTILYFAVYHLVLMVFPDKLLTRLQLHHLLATIAVALSLAPAHGRIQKFADQIFDRQNLLNSGELIQKSSKLLSFISTLQELVVVVRNLLIESMAPERVWVLIREDGRLVEVATGEDVYSRSITLEHDGPLVRFVSSRRNTQVVDMLERMRPDPLVDTAVVQLKSLGASLVAGIYSRSELVGMLLLGPRTNGKIYGLIEQEAIEGLCNQLAVSIENAKLYTEVQNSRIYNDILLDRLVGGVIAVNADKCVTVFNREAQRLTGLDQQDVLGAGSSILPEILRKSLDLAFSNGGSRDVDAVLEGNRKSVPIRYGSTLFHSHTGNVLGALVVFTDQTELKKLEQQIRRTDRLASLGTLAAGMAHEIKNPLVSMKTFTQLLPERYEDSDFRDTFSRLLGDEVNRIDRIVNQLLRFARPTKPSLSPVSLHAIIDNTLNLVKQQLRQNNISLVREYGASVDRILGDNDMLIQALLNFFLNAIDAMTDQGELKVVTCIVKKPTQQYDLWGQPVTTSLLRLTISDNGKGIDKEDMLHVFDPFFTTKATGTGLGLSVSHGIIHEHHGVIDVESELGNGTSFHIVFPLHEQEVPA